MKGEVMSESIGVVEQQIAAYRRANPSARALTDTQILAIMTQSGEIKKSAETLRAKKPRVQQKETIKRNNRHQVNVTKN